MTEGLVVPLKEPALGAERGDTWIWSPLLQPDVQVQGRGWAMGVGKVNVQHLNRAPLFLPRGLTPGVLEFLLPTSPVYSGFLSSCCLAFTFMETGAI